MEKSESRSLEAGFRLYDRGPKSKFAQRTVISHDKLPPPTLRHVAVTSSIQYAVSTYVLRAYRFNTWSIKEVCCNASN